MFVKKEDARDGHDRCAACQNDGHRREWAAFLENKKKSDGARAYANSSQRRIVEALTAEFLIPTAREMKDGEV